MKNKRMALAASLSARREGRGEVVPRATPRALAVALRRRARKKLRAHRTALSYINGIYPLGVCLPRYPRHD